MLALFAYTVLFQRNEIHSLQRFSPYPGYPELPVKIVAVELAPDEYVREIDVKRVRRVPINYAFTYTEVVDTPGGGEVRRVLPEDYPESVVFVGNQGFLRGRKIAFVVVSAITVEGGRTYLNEEVEFEIVKGHETPDYEVPARSNLKVWKDVFASLNLPLLQDSYVPGNSIDFVILTTEELKPFWKPLAELRNAMGIRTEIFTVEWIRANFSGRSDPERIRNFLRYAYRTWGITYLLIGAPPEYVPPLRTYIMTFADTSSDWFGRYFHNLELTDYYYSALDGDWNPTGDAWDGDMEGRWDRFIDLMPDIIVGRYPARSPEDVRNYISSVYEYETRTDFSVPKYMFFASNLWGDTVDPDSADGCLITYDLGASLTVGDKIYLCERPAVEVRDSINSYSPTFLFGIGHSNHRIIMTRNTHSAYDAYDYNRVAQITSPRKYVAGWIGCFINDPFDNSIGLEMVRRGKAVASVGAAKADYSLSAITFWGPFLDSLMNRSGFPHLGDVAFEVKVNLIAIANSSPLYRHLLFSYHIIGDPLVRVFNVPRRPIEVAVSSSSSTVNFHVRDSVTSSPLMGARVGATDGRVAYGPEYTDVAGNVTLGVPPGRTVWGVWYPSSLIKVGTLSVYASGPFLKVDSASISSPGDTAILSVWIRNGGSDDVNGFLPTLLTYDFYVLTSPPPADVPAGATVRYDWTVVKSPYLSSPTAMVRVVGPYLNDTFHLSVAIPKLDFVSATWHSHYDTVFLFFNVANHGTDTARDVRVVPDSTALSVLSTDTYGPLPPGASTDYTLQMRLLGVPSDGERIRFRLYAGGVLYDTFSIVLRSSLPVPILRGYWTESGQGEVTLRWEYVPIDSVRVTWRVASGTRTLNVRELTGSYFSLMGDPLVRETVVVYPVIDGVEGPPLFSTVIAPQPEMVRSRYLDLILFSSAPVRTSNSQVIMAQLLNYTAEPEIVVATTYNRIFALTYDARRVIWDTYTDGWIEVPPLVADVNGDGKYEVVFATTFYLYALSGYDGSVVWRTPMPTFPGEVDSMPSPMYLMITRPFSDSTPYILMLTHHGSALLFNGRGDLVAYRLDSVASYDIRDTARISPPATYDVDGDGNYEIIYRVKDSLYVMDGTLNPLPGFPLYLSGLSTGLFVHDMDHDSENEIFLCGHRNYVIEFDGTITLYDDNAYYSNYLCLPLDFNGDGKMDVAFYHPVLPNVGVWEVQDTGLVPLMRENLVISTKAKFGISADVDGNGTDELLISDTRSRLHAYSYGWDLPDLPGFPIDLSDGNGLRSSEVVSPSAFNYNGHLYVYGPTEANILYVWRGFGESEWATRFANRWATNSPVDSLPDEVPVNVAELVSRPKDLTYTLKDRTIVISGQGRIDVRLYSVSGRLLKHLTGNDEVKAELKLPRGVYLIKARDDLRMRIFKVIVR